MKKHYKKKLPSLSKLDEQSKQYIEVKIKNILENKWFELNNFEYIIHVGPTNSGKTYHAVEDLKTAKNGVYLCPLRLLAWEISEKLNKLGLDCNLITGEEKIIIPNAQITSSTIEMCNYGKHYDVAIIDECFMLSDEDRGKSWFKAIMEIKADKIYIITNEESLQLIEYIFNITNKKYTTIQHKRLVPLKISDEVVKLKKVPKKSILVVFSRINALVNKKILESIGYKVSVLYGNLPPEVKREQMRRFIDDETDIIVSTDVIGMGLNLPANNVIFLEGEKFDGEDVRPLNATEIKQIGGRAGRYLLSDEGIVYTTNQNFISKIKSAFKSIKNVPLKSFYGVEKDIISLIDLPTLKEKLVTFKSLDIIPNKLKSLIGLENIEKYLNLAKYSNIDKLPFDLSWAMLIMPVKSQNMDYWIESLDLIANGDKIRCPSIYLKEIKNIDELTYAESSAADLDLFMYFCNNTEIKKHINPNDIIHISDIKELKNILIENINMFLVNSKLLKLKNCPKCGNPMYHTCKNCVI